MTTAKDLAERLSIAAMELPGETRAYVRQYIVDVHDYLSRLDALGEGDETTEADRATAIEGWPHGFEAKLSRDLDRRTVALAEAKARIEAALNEIEWRNRNDRR